MIILLNRYLDRTKEDSEVVLKWSHVEILVTTQSRHVLGSTGTRTRGQ